MIEDLQSHQTFTIAKNFTDTSQSRLIKASPYRIIRVLQVDG